MTSKTDKLRAVFLTALMIGSVFAAGVAFTGSAAADVTDAGDPGDVAVGIDGTSHTISNFDVSTATASINIEELNESADLSSDNADYTGASTNGDATVEITNLDNSDPATIAISSGTNDDASDVTAVTISGIDTSDSDSATGLSYEVEDANSNTGTTSEFALVDSEVTSLDSVVPTNNTIESGSDSFDQDLEVGVTAADGETDNVSIDVSELTATGTTIDSLAFSGDTDVTVETDAADAYEEGDSSIDFEVAGSSNNDLNTETITVDLTLNTTETTSDNRVTLTASDDAGNEFTDRVKTYVEGSTVIDNSSGIDPDSDVYAGEIVTFKNGSTDAQIEIFPVNSDNNRQTREAVLSTSPGNVVNFDTSDLDTGTYNASFNGEPAASDFQFTVYDLGWTAEAVDTSVTNEQNLEADISGEEPNAAYAAVLLNDDGDEVDGVDAITGTTDGSGEDTVAFDAQELELDTGNYSIAVTHSDSGVTATTDEIEVTDAADDTASFENIDSSAVGDISTVNVSLTGTQTATVNIGTEEAGYQANVTVTDGNDDGYVELSVNTYTMGGNTDADRSNAFYVAGDTDDEVDSVDFRFDEGLSSPIDSNNYRTTVRAGTDASATANAISRLRLTDAEGVTAQNIWTAPAATENGDFPNDATLTQDDSITNGDYIVHEIEADGVFGILQNASTDSDLAALSGAIANDEIDLSVNQTEDSTRANRDAQYLDYLTTLTAEDGAVVADTENSTIYVAIDSAAVETSDRDIRLGTDVFNATVALNGTTTELVDEDAGAASSEFTIDALEHELTMDTYNVTNADNQSIAGTSNAADGTAYNVYVESDETEGDGFIEPTNAATVEDGELTAEVDFSDASVGDTFTVILEDPDADEVDTATGNVVEDAGGDDPTTTADDSTTTADDDTTTADDDTTTDEPTDTTADDDTTTAADDTTTSGDDGGSDGGDIPGFGVGIALVALLGAALLALRE